MSGSQWLDEVARRASQRLLDVDVSRPDRETIGLSRGLRTVVIHVDGDQALLAPSFVAGGTLGSRLGQRVQHLDFQSYRVSEATVDVALGGVLAHLGT